MNLTIEQNGIITCVVNAKSGEIIKINAFAGTGKTFILIQIAKALPQKRILYLAFNNSIVAESKRKFPKNVHIFTTHSLAYKAIVKNKIVGDDYKPIEVASILKIDIEKAHGALKILNSFFNSSKEKIPLGGDENQYAIRLYEKMENGEIPITHSYYLKKFQLLKNHGLDKYDLVLLDEAQDTNDVVLDIFLKTKGIKVLVGDTHQAIYGFRGANDAMSKIKADHSFYLSTTFRCSKPVVDMANFVLKHFKGEKVPIVSLATGSPENNSSAVIARTNAKIIEVLGETAKNYKLLKNPKAIFGLPFAIDSFLNGKKEKVGENFKWLLSFKDEEELKEYAATTNDIELSGSISVAKRYGKRLGWLYKTASKAYHSANLENRVHLVTAHISKGLEFDAISIENDFPALDAIFADTKEGKMNPIEEANLYYVTLTRAKWFIEDNSKNSKFFILE